MSRQNKVNPEQYKQAGRLAPDDAARERMKVLRASPQHDVVARPPKTPQNDEAPGLQSPEEPVKRGGPITATARRKAAASRR